MHSFGVGEPDPITAIERLDTILAHVEAVHAAGLAWGGLPIRGEDIVGTPGRESDPLEATPAPSMTARMGARADVNMLRRILAVSAAELRYGRVDRELACAAADAMCLGRGALSVADMRDRVRGELLLRLRHIRRDIGRRIDASGSVDIRLDAWGHVGTPARSGIRQYLDGVLEQQADFATFSRSRLGRFVDRRHRVDAAIERVEALYAFGDQAPRRRADSGPITLAAVTAPETPGAEAPRASDVAG